MDLVKRLTLETEAAQYDGAIVDAKIAERKQDSPKAPRKSSIPNTEEVGNENTAENVDEKLRKLLKIDKNQETKASATTKPNRASTRRRFVNKKNAEDVETFRGMLAFSTLSLLDPIIELLTWFLTPHTFDLISGSMIDELCNNKYECMVCCDVIRRDGAVWSCSNCFHIFHFRRITKWAKTPNATAEGL